MLARADDRFLSRLAKIKGLPKDYLLGTLERDGGVRDGRIVSLSLVGFEGTSLDVSDLDALERLEVVGRHQPDGTTKGPLASIVLGELPRLERLGLEGFPALAELDLSGCPALLELAIPRDGFEAAPALPPKLDALSLDGNAALRACSLRSRTLRRLDVSRCGLDALEALSCSGNGAPDITLPEGAPLRELAMSKNPRERFDASAYPALAKLFVDGAGLRSLTLANPALEHLYWKSEPGDLARYATAKSAPRAEREWVELLREIEAGVANAKKPRWKPNAIAFDVRDVGGVDLSEDDPAIPAAMRAPVVGASMETETPRTPRRSGKAATAAKAAKAAKAKAKAKAKASASKTSAAREARRPRRAK
jgi:hypothetical protein